MYGSNQGKKIKPLSIGKIRNIVYDFCQSTSLHGYSYIVTNDSLVLKAMWVILIMTMTGLGTYFLSINTMEFFEAKMTTDIESSSAPLTVKIYISISTNEMLNFQTRLPNKF